MSYSLCTDVVNSFELQLCACGLRQCSLIMFDSCGGNKLFSCGVNGLCDWIGLCA